MAATTLRGYAIDKGEFRTNIYSIGVAINLPDREVIAALEISAPDINLSDGDIKRFGALVKDAAGSTSNTLDRL